MSAILFECIAHVGIGQSVWQNTERKVLKRKSNSPGTAYDTFRLKAERILQGSDHGDSYIQQQCQIATALSTEFLESLMKHRHSKSRHPVFFEQQWEAAEEASLANKILRLSTQCDSLHLWMPNDKPCAVQKDHFAFWIHFAQRATAEETVPVMSVFTLPSKKDAVVNQEHLKPPLDRFSQCEKLDGHKYLWPLVYPLLLTRFRAGGVTPQEWQVWHNTLVQLYSKMGVWNEKSGGLKQFRR